jgi:hypothetical protein
MLGRNEQGKHSRFVKGKKSQAQKPDRPLLPTDMKPRFPHREEGDKEKGVSRCRKYWRWRAWKKPLKYFSRIASATEAGILTA